MNHEFRIASLQPREYLWSEWHISWTAILSPQKRKKKNLNVCDNVFQSSPEGHLCFLLTSESCWGEFMFYGSFLGDHLCSPVFDIRGLGLFVGVSKGEREGGSLFGMLTALL